MAKVFYAQVGAEISTAVEVLNSRENLLAQLKSHDLNLFLDLPDGGFMVIDCDQIAVLRFEPSPPALGDRAQIETAVQQNNAARNGGFSLF